MSSKLIPFAETSSRSRVGDGKGGTGNASVGTALFFVEPCRTYREDLGHSPPKRADVPVAVAAHTLENFFLARSILHLECRTLLRPTLPAIVEPGRRNVGMPEPFLHTRQRSASAQHVRRPSLLQTQALVSLWGGQQPRCLTARRGARHGARAPGPSADGPGPPGAYTSSNR